MNRILCWLKATPFWVKTGVWCPHTFREVRREPAIIITNKDGFRVSNNYMHNDGENVHENATLIRNKCKYCGKEEFSWIKDLHLELE